MGEQLPKNWVEVTIPEFITKDNIFIDGDWIETKDQDPEGQVRLIQLADIGIGTFRNKSNRFMNIDNAKKLNCTFLNQGDILVARMPDPIGRACIFPLIGENVTVVDIAIIRPNDKFINNKLLMYFINSPQINNEISNLASGSTRQRISRKNLGTIKFPLPPLAEQNRIVTKLDTLFAQLEAIKTKIENLKNISNRFTSSCLVDLKNNKFHDREKIGQYLEEGTERIGTNWKNIRLIGVSAKEGITNLRIGQKESFEKYKIVRPGDFIYNTMRVNIGSIAIYDGTENALTSPDYVVFRVSKHLSSRLLVNFLKSDQGLLEIGANTKGSVRARLYFKALSEIRMPIAPIKVQNFAENFLKGFNITLNSLNTLKQTSLDKLSPSILAKAFKGELVTQLNSDGHASELLQQIQVLKANYKARKK